MDPLRRDRLIHALANRFIYIESNKTVLILEVEQMFHYLSSCRHKNVCRFSFLPLSNTLQT